MFTTFWTKKHLNKQINVLGTFNPDLGLWWANLDLLIGNGSLNQIGRDTMLFIIGGS